MKSNSVHDTRGKEELVSKKPFPAIRKGVTDQ
jgi:hypothetical protein